MEQQNYSKLNHFDNLINMIILADKIKTKKAEVGQGIGKFRKRVVK